MSSFLNQDFGDSESEGEDFNPAAHESDDDEDVRSPVKRATKSEDRKRVVSSDDEDRNANGVSDVEDAEGDDDNDEKAVAEDGEGGEDEEDEDDDDEEEDEDDRPRKRLKNRRRLQFIDEEAEVDDEDEEEDLEDDDLPDERHPDDDAELAVGGENDERRHRELDRARERAQEVDAEKQAALLKERYGRQRTAVNEASGIPQHLLLPSVDDPSIWLVKCKPGKETEVVNTIMKRFADRLSSPKPIGITSCFTRPGGVMAGILYVEARRKNMVEEAILNVPFCYGAHNMQIIKIGEMPDLLKVRRPKEIKIGDYVRMKRPMKYSGDLAQVVDVESNASEVTVKLVPRLDFSEDTSDTTQVKRKRPGAAVHRPPAKMINEQEARKKWNRHVQRRGKNNFTIHGEEFDGGFLIKTVKFNAVSSENVNPTLEEATRFAASAEDGDGQAKELDLQALANTIKQSSLLDDYLPGDIVEVFSGEQKGVRGKTAAVHSGIVTIIVTAGELKGQRIEAPTKTLRKFFREGDAAKVLSNSKYHGESGLVVKVHEDKVTLLTDSNRQEITVFSRDLRLAQDAAAPLSVSKFDLFDMVQLDAATIGCVVKVDRETLRVIDQNGIVRTMLPSSISDKLDTRRPAIATDKDGTEIHVEDVVREISGLQRKGEVKFIHRNNVFLQDRLVLENSGMFVAKGNAVVVQSAKGARPIDAPDLTRMNPALRNGANAAGAMPPPAKNQGRDRLEGREVMVCKGPQKGLKGRVRDATSSHVRIEFHSKPGIHAFKRDMLKLKDPHSDQYYPIGQTMARRPPGSMGAPGGMLQSRVPAGARTPAGAGLNSGGRTPAWGQFADGNKTPSWVRANDGGNKTPHWGQQMDGSRTVLHAQDGSRTAYGGDYSGSKTPNPGLYNSAPTPGGYGAAATPAPYDAPTPGANYLAATPAAFDAPTPRNPYASYGTPAASAPTPAAFAETPGYSAATPAAMDYDDEPRYD